MKNHYSIRAIFGCALTTAALTACEPPRRLDKLMEKAAITEVYGVALKSSASPRELEYMRPEILNEVISRRVAWIEHYNVQVGKGALTVYDIGPQSQYLKIGSTGTNTGTRHFPFTDDTGLKLYGPSFASLFKWLRDHHEYAEGGAKGKYPLPADWPPK